MGSPPPIPIVRTSTLTIRVVNEERCSYLVFRGHEAHEDIWLRRDLVVRTDTTASGLWVSGLFRIHDRPNFIHIDSAPEDAQQAHATLGSQLDIPPRFVSVAFDDLVRDPATYAGQWIDCQGRWCLGLERSSFAGAWVRRPYDATLPRHGELDLRIQGLFNHSPDRPGYGHLGASRSQLALFDSEPRLPGVAHSWLDEPPE